MSIFLAMAAAAVFAQDGTVLTLDEAMRIAEENAFSVKIEQANVEQQRQRVNESAGALGPRVLVGATYTRYDEETTAKLGPDPSPEVVFQPIDTTTANARLTLPIDISGNIRRILDASKTNLMARKETLEATRNDLRRDVKQTYYNVIRADSLYEVAMNANRNAKARLDNAQKQRDAGVLANVDVLRFETEVSRTESDLISASTSLALSKNLLNNLLGRPIETPFDVEAIQQMPEFPTEPNAFYPVAVDYRPEVKALEHTIEALAKVRRAEERGTNPSLTLNLNYFRNIDNDSVTSRDESTTGTLELTFPIFDSGVTRARVKAARQDEERAQIQLQQLKLGVSLDVRQALTNLTNAKGRLEVAEKQLELAQETYRLSKVRFEAGEGIQLEILDAQTELTRAETGLVTARYDYLSAYADLQRALGGIDPNEASGLEEKEQD